MADEVHDADPELLAQAVRGVSVPDRVETPLGSFELVDGVPTAESVDRLYDALDFMRGVEAFLNAVPGASLVAMRRGFRSIGLTGSDQIGYTEPRANSGSLFLTPNTETTYGTMFFDLRETGPFVIEPPTQSLCVVDDFWFRYVADMGIAGPDRGEGGKYLFLPPGYDGEVPDGYFIYRRRPSPTGSVFRALGGVAGHEGDPGLPARRRRRPAAERVRQHRRRCHFNTVHANDVSFFEEVDELVQEEPPTALDPERAGQLAGDRHRPREAVRTRRAARGPSSRRPPTPAPRSAGRWSTRPGTPRRRSPRGRRGSRPSSAAATSSSATAPACSTPAPRSTTSPP